jgi:hypothetical protein
MIDEPSQPPWLAISVESIGVRAQNVIHLPVVVDIPTPALDRRDGVAMDAGAMDGPAQLATYEQDQDHKHPNADLDAEGQSQSVFPSNVMLSTFVDYTHPHASWQAFSRA